MCWGALVRVVLRRFHLNIPYTVVLMLSGFGFGFISKHFCDELHIFTAVARIHPEIILLTFLPVLIFESAFSISVHTFTRSAISVKSIFHRNFGKDKHVRTYFLQLLFLL